MKLYLNLCLIMHSYTFTMVTLAHTQIHSSISRSSSVNIIFLSYYLVKGLGNLNYLTNHTLPGRLSSEHSSY